MTPLAHLVKQNFKKFTFDKGGGLFIEASVVMPLACIITIMMIQIAILFYNDFSKQVDDHKLEISQKSYFLQTEMIRNYENVFQ